MAAIGAKPRRRSGGRLNAPRRMHAGVHTVGNVAQNDHPDGASSTAPASMRKPA